MADDLADPFTFRERIRRTVPASLAKLTGEYDRYSEPLRVALNAVLTASQEEWPEALFAAGPHLQAFDLSDPMWGFPARPAHDASDEVWGKYAVLELARAAAAGDRNEFERLRENLMAEPGVAACAAEGRRFVSLCFMERSRREARALILEKARTELQKVGLELTSASITSLSRAQCHLAPRVEDALRHWINPDSSQAWIFEGTLAPLGCRPSLVEAPPPPPKPNAPPKSPSGPHSTPTNATEAIERLLRMLANGASGHKLRQATAVLMNDTQSANEKLTRLHELQMVPPTASAQTLADLIGVTRAAIFQTEWWRVNRRGEQNAVVDRRESKMRDRGEVYEPGHDAEDED